MINMTLLRDVAKHLSGRQAVIVRYQPPVWDNASGACYKTVGGGAIIDINPGARDFLSTFLHEVAHLRYDFSQMTPANVWKYDPGSLKVKADLSTKVREDIADLQAERWKQYAIENAWRYNRGDNLLEKELLALLNASDPYRNKQSDFKDWAARQQNNNSTVNKIINLNKRGMK
jgi:hypothetical protein